jgi:hypothetical protein
MRQRVRNVVVGEAPEVLRDDRILHLLSFALAVERLRQCRAGSGHYDLFELVFRRLLLGHRRGAERDADQGERNSFV